MIPQRLKDYLEEEHVMYEVHWHPECFTSQEVAAVAHVSGREVAKVVIVKAGTKDVMVVLPAHRKVDLLKLSVALGTDDIRIEKEKEFADFFPDCERGAMPPIGKLYRIPCYIDQSLLESDEIFFNGGNHRETVRLASRDFLRIAEGEVGDFAARAYVNW